MQVNETPETLWKSIREGNFTKHTSGVCNGFAQANLVILPKAQALDFMIFCSRNQKACPVIDVLEPGTFVPPSSPGSDIRTDIPKYRLYRNGELAEEISDITHLWREDFVTFLLGCSFTFEWALINAGISMRHMEEGRNVAMFKTNIPCKAGGIFKGNTVVSMRPFKNHLIPKVVQITSRTPAVHGAPIHIGNPQAIGIEDIHSPDYGDPVEITENELPVFWACGVTPQLVALESKPEMMITHAPGYMFVTKIKNDDLIL